MRYVKTFENFNYEPLNEGIIDWAKGIWNKAKAWWQNWKDERKKKAAQAIATALEENKDNPEVQKKLAEIKAAQENLSPEEKKQLETLKDENKIDELAKKLEGAGPELAAPIKESIFYLSACGKLNEDNEINEDLLLEGFADYLKKALSILGFSVAIISVIIMMVGLCTMTGGGFIASAAPLVGGMSAGSFCAIMCAIMAAGGITGSVAKNY